jgi:hypothetical protein
VDTDTQLERKLERWNYPVDRQTDNRCQSLGCAICSYNFGWLPPVGCISYYVHRNGRPGSAQRCLSKCACCQSVFVTVFLIAAALIFMLYVEPAVNSI